MCVHRISSIIIDHPLYWACPLTSGVVSRSAAWGEMKVPSLFIFVWLHEFGRRRTGRPRRKWMDEIHVHAHEVTGLQLAELRDVTTERKQWRRLVKTVAIGLKESTAQGD